uniref:SRP9 domain-containing protein n=1 Tax=Castor canadensis TaxID=51338 RepID=A0A8C0X2Q6_CASCN
MPQYQTWEEFSRAAEKLYLADPMKVRVVLKYRHADGNLCIKVTDDSVESCFWKFSSPQCWAFSSTGISPGTRRKLWHLKMGGGGPGQSPQPGRTRASAPSRWKRQMRRSRTYTRGSITSAGPHLWRTVASITGSTPTT